MLPSRRKKYRERMLCPATSRYSCEGCPVHEVKYKVYRLKPEHFDFQPIPAGYVPMRGWWRFEKYLNGELISRDGGDSAKAIWNVLRMRGW